MVFATRNLDAEQFGLYGKASLCIAIAGIVTDLGLSNGLIAYSGSDKRYAAFHLQATTFLALASSLATYLLIHFRIIFSELQPFATLLASIILLETACINGLILSQKNYRFKALATLESGCAVISFGATVCLLLNFPSFTSLLLARAAEGALRASTVFIMESRHYLNFAWGRDLWNYYIVKFVRHGAMQAWVQTLHSQTEIFILSYFSTNQQLGIYERIQQFIRVPLSASVNLVDKVALISYSKNQHDQKILIRLFIKFTLIIAALNISAIALFSLIFPQLLKTFTTTTWTSELMPLWWLSIPLMLIKPISWGINILFQGSGKATHLTISLAFLFFSTLFFGVILTPIYKTQGMIIAVTASYLSLLIVQVLLLIKISRQRLDSALKHPI